MFRTGEKYDYATCQACDTLQIVDIPHDMSKHYPPDYYSFAPLYEFNSGWRRVLKRFLLSVALRFPKSRAASFYRQRAPWLLMIPDLSRSSTILDVGCGRGALLDELREWGFRNLFGADPFIAAEIRRGPILIRKEDLADVKDKYHVVMMHHSLEHVDDPRQSLIEARDHLAPGGSIVIRIPLKGGYLWETYGKDWVQIDPPRHFHLFTQASFLQLARSVGLLPRGLYYDAEEFSIRGTEAARKGLSIWDHDSFSEDERQHFKSKIEELNAAGQSDQACFVLYAA
jgi:SAM-dependent methyltransferase